MVLPFRLSIKKKNLIDKFLWSFLVSAYVLGLLYNIWTFFLTKSCSLPKRICSFQSEMAKMPLHDLSHTSAN